MYTVSPRQSFPLEDGQANKQGDYTLYFLEK